MIEPRSTPRGRPLVFLAILATGWVGIRMISLALSGMIAEPHSSPNLAPPLAAVPAPSHAPADPKARGERGKVESDPDAASAATPSVAGLGDPPPAHLSQQLDTPLPGASHNALWMAASSAPLVLSGRPEAAAGGEIFPEETDSGSD